MLGSNTTDQDQSTALFRVALFTTECKKKDCMLLNENCALFDVFLLYLSINVSRYFVSVSDVESYLTDREMILFSHSRFKS